MYTLFQYFIPSIILHVDCKRFLGAKAEERFFHLVLHQTTECKGVTFTRDKYELRKGIAIRESTLNEESWLKPGTFNAWL